MAEKKRIVTWEECGDQLLVSIGKMTEEDKEYRKMVREEEELYGVQGG